MIQVEPGKVKMGARGNRELIFQTGKVHGSENIGERLSGTDWALRKSTQEKRKANGKGSNSS